MNPAIRRDIQVIPQYSRQSFRARHLLRAEQPSTASPIQVRVNVGRRKIMRQKVCALENVLKQRGPQAKQTADKKAQCKGGTMRPPRDEAHPNTLNKS